MIDRRILYITLILFLIPSVSAKPENTFVDNIKLALGLDHNEIIVSSQDNHKLDDTFSIQSTYDTNNIRWYLDGQEVRNVGVARNSVYRVDTSVLPKSKSSKDIIGYKLGKDKKTGLQIHEVDVKYDGGMNSWFVLQ